MDSKDVVYIIAFLFSASFGCYYRTIRDKNLKKNVGTCVGLAIALIVSGVHFLHSLVIVLINAIIILKVNKRQCHTVSFIFSFLYLIFFRTTVYFGIPSPPIHTNLIQMVLTLKLVGLACEIHSSQTHSGKSEEEQARDEMTKIEVNLTDIIHYCFNYVGVLAGPYFKYRTFVDYFEYPFAQRVQWKKMVFNEIKYLPLYVIILSVIVYIWPISYMTTEEFYQRSWLYRFCYAIPIFVAFTMKMTICLVIQNIVCMTTGFGVYPSFTNPKPGLGPSKQFSDMKKLLSDEEKLSTIEYSFQTINSIKVYQVNFCMRFKEYGASWNCCVQYWLVANVYQRFANKQYGRVATLFVSSLWHGTHMGYYFLSILAGIILITEDVYIKLYPRDPEGKFLTLYKWTYWYFRLHYSSYIIVSFLLLRPHLILKYYNSIHHIGLILAIILFVIVMFLLKVKTIKENKIRQWKTYNNNN